MGTNYYYKHREDDQTEFHIGKECGGWEFSFQAYDEIRSWKDWQRVLKDAYIFDEYGEAISFEDFVKLVEGSREGENQTEWVRRNRSYYHSDYYLDDEGYSFTEIEFS